MKLRKIVAVALIACFAFALPVQAQNPFSTAAIQAWKQSITAAGYMGAPRYTTALLPTCDANNIGALAYDTTATTLKVCVTATWTQAGVALTGTNSWSGVNTFTGGIIAASTGAGTPTIFQVPALSLVTGANNFCMGTLSCAALTSGTGNLVIGHNAGDGFAAINDNTIIGFNAGTGSNLGTQNTALGATALDATNNTSAANNVALGYSSLGSLTTGGSNVCIGHGCGGSVTTGAGNIGIGQSAGPSSNVGGTICLGHNCTATAANQLVFGGGNSSTEINDVYLGLGVTVSAPTASVKINSNGASGTDIAGGALVIAGGKGTGTGAGGNVILQASPSLATGTTLQTLSDRLVVMAKAKAIPDNSATTFARVSIPSDTTTIVMIFYSMEAKNASDVQVIGGMATIAITNDAGAEACGTIVEAGETTSASTGTITSTITCTGAGTDTIDLAMTSDTSLNVTGALTWTAMRTGGTGTVITQ